MKCVRKGVGVVCCGSCKLIPKSKSCCRSRSVESLQVTGRKVGGGLYSHDVGSGSGGVIKRKKCFVFSVFMRVW